MEGGFFTALLCLLLCSFSFTGLMIVLVALTYNRTRKLALVTAGLGLIVGFVFIIVFGDYLDAWKDIFLSQGNLGFKIVGLLFLVFLGMCSGFGIGSVASSVIIFPIAGIVALVRSRRKSINPQPPPNTGST